MKRKYLERKVNIRQPDGSFKLMSVYGKTYKELDAKIRARQTASEATWQRSRQKNFKTVSEEWQEAHTKRVSENTAECYVSPLKDLQARFGDYLLEDISALELQQHLDKMALQGYAKQTIKLRLIVVNLVYKYAMLHDYVHYNPAQAVEVPKRAKTTKRVLPEQWEIDKALEEGSLSLSLGLYLPFLYYTGCRKCEALALTAEDIDTENDLIHIRKKIIYVNNRPVLKAGSKTESGVRSVPLLAPLKEMLKGKSGILFADQDGGYLHKSHFDKLFADYQKATGIQSTSHQFRHAFATLCYDAGLEDKDAAEILGHSKIETTKNIYTHIKEQRRKSFTDKLNKIVS